MKGNETIISYDLLCPYFHQLPNEVHISSRNEWKTNEGSKIITKKIFN